MGQLGLKTRCAGNGASRARATRWSRSHCQSGRTDRTCNALRPLRTRCASGSRSADRACRTGNRAGSTGSARWTCCTCRAGYSVAPATPAGPCVPTTRGHFANVPVASEQTTPADTVADAGKPGNVTGPAPSMMRRVAAPVASLTTTLPPGGALILRSAA